MNNKDMKRYCREVKLLLPGGFRRKRKLMKGLRDSLVRYLEDVAEADYSVIVRHFGTPAQIAVSYMEEMEPQEVLRELNVRKKIVRILVISMTSIVLLWGVGVLISAVDFANSTGGYFDVYITP